MWVYNYAPSTELYHHGILGQKWGKRNGPPYPLDSTDHSASEKKAGWRKSLDKSAAKTDNKSSSEKKQGLTDKQKKAIKIGAAVAVTALAAIGTYQLYKSGKLDGVISKGKSAVDSITGSTKEAASPIFGSFGEVAGQLDQSVLDEMSAKTGLKRTNFNKYLSPTSVSIMVGTERRQVLDNAGPSEATGWRNNCSHASMAYILNRMGFDVKPEPTNFLNGHETVQGLTDMNDLCSIFKNSKTGSSSARSVQELASDIKTKFGDVDGSYGFIGGSGVYNGHVFVWENVKGKIEIHNPQDESAITVLRSAINDGYWTNYHLSRVDGCSFNDNYRNLGDADVVYERIKSMVSNQ